MLTNQTIALSMLLVYTLLLLVAPCLGLVPLPTKDSLEALYTSTNGANWNDATNWLQGDPCDQQWFGVECTPDGTAVVGLDLGSNNLNGTLVELDLPLLGILYVALSSHRTAPTFIYFLYFIF